MIAHNHIFFVNLDGSAGVLSDLGIYVSSGLALLFQTLLHAEQFAVFLGQLVLLSGLGFGGGLQAANLNVQLQNLVNDGIAVHFLGLQAGLDCVGIFLDLLDV